MNFQEALKKIELIEKEFPVDIWTINDFHVWPQIRLVIYNLYLNKNNTPKISKTVSAFSKFTSAFKFIYLAILFEFKNFTAEILTLGFTSDFALVNGKYFNRNIDYFNLKCKEYGLKLAPFEIETKEIPFNKSSISYNITNSFQSNIFVNVLILKIKYRLFKSDKCNLNNYESLLEYLRNDGLNVSSISIKALKYDSVYRKAEFVYFKRLVKRIKPKLVIVSYFLDKANNTLIAAAKSVGVKTMEVQHGVAGNVHIAYFHWSKFPKNGYEVFPDIFWTWSNLEANAINTWNFTNTNYKPFVLPGGNIWLESWKENLLVEFFESRNDFSQLIDCSKINVLISLQSDSIPQIFIDIIKLNLPNYHFWIRIHPSMLSNRDYYINNFKYLVGKFDIVNASSFPLFAILPSMNLHITDYSSVAIDAAKFGIKTIFISKEGAWFFKEFIPSTFFRICENKKDFIIQANDLIKDAHKENVNINTSVEKDCFSFLVSRFIK